MGNGRSVVQAKEGTHLPMPPVCPLCLHNTSTIAHHQLLGTHNVRNTAQMYTSTPCDHPCPCNPKPHPLHFSISLSHIGEPHLSLCALSLQVNEAVPLTHPQVKVPACLPPPLPSGCHCNAQYYHQHCPSLLNCTNWWQCPRPQSCPPPSLTVTQW